MPIKFDCACGQRIRARDGSAGRRVRCPSCRADLDVPGGSLDTAGGAGLGGGVDAALRWQERRASRRARPERSRVVTAAEQWLMEHGVWVPLGVAIVTLFAVVGVVAYAAGLTTLVQFSAFMLLIGLGSLLYGLFELKQVAGMKDEEDRPGGDGAGP
jgi:hypothetical protein